MRLYEFVILMSFVGTFVTGCDRQDAKAVPEERVGQKSEKDSVELAFPSMTVGNSNSDSDDVAPGNLSFVDVARERGLNFVWPQQPRPMTALDAFGAGCASFDSDDDGWQDILLVGSPCPAFFRNVEGIGFKDLSEESGFKGLTGHWTGCSIADYDADGRLDVLLTGYHQLALLKNLDGLHFREVTNSTGLDPNNHGLWGASSGFMDLDGDELLDLVILNYVIYGPDTQKYCEYTPGVRSGCGPKTYLPERGQIWRNTGASTFELVPPEQAMQHTHGVGLVLAFSDFDDDRRMDFYIGNDGVAADLLHNKGSFHFDNVAGVAGVATSDNGNAVSAMGADWGDFDRDGKLDLVVTNWQGDAFVLFQNLGNLLFVDCAKGTDLARRTKNRLGFGAKWIDFENDGWLDLFFVNGHVYDNSAEIHGPSVPFRQPPFLFWNRRGKRFIDIVGQLGPDVQRTMVGRGSATIDFNNDGKVDLLAVDFEGPVMLLENRTETNHHWLTLDLRGRKPNLFASGAHVVGQSGDRVWLADVSPASSYLSSSDPRVHWGLGDITSLETLTIRWTSGFTQTLHDVACDQILRIVENHP